MEMTICEKYDAHVALELQGRQDIQILPQYIGPGFLRKMCQDFDGK